MEFTIDRMQAGDWAQVKSVYLEGIATGNATFETGVPDWSGWNASHLPSGRLVARNDKSIIGWAALSQISTRPVYSGVAEVSVYVAAAARGSGVGHALLSKLIEESERAGVWTLQAGILPENIASLSLHKRCGFREVGRRDRLGKLNGAWRDVILLERRSQIVG